MERFLDCIGTCCSSVWCKSEWECKSSGCTSTPWDANGADVSTSVIKLIDLPTYRLEGREALEKMDGWRSEWGAKANLISPSQMSIVSWESVTPWTHLSVGLSQGSALAGAALLRYPHAQHRHFPSKPVPQNRCVAWGKTGIWGGCVSGEAAEITSLWKLFSFCSCSFLP